MANRCTWWCPVTTSARGWPSIRSAHCAADDRVSLVLVDDGSTDDTLELLRSIERDTPSVTRDRVAAQRGKGRGGARRLGLGIDGRPVMARLRRRRHGHARQRDPSAAGCRRPAHRRRCRARLPRGVAGARCAALGVPPLHGTSVRHVGEPRVGQGGLRHPMRREAVPPHRRVRPVDRRTVSQPVGVRRGTARPIGVAGVEASRFWEEPLLVWHDVGGSRRTLGASIRASVELLPIWRDLRRARR